MTDPSLVRFRAVVAGALAHLESRRQEINDLNVFPVADGDTGDNMALTLHAVLDELDRLATDEDRTLDEIGREEIVDSVARAALLGARGNSGVILSQLIRGAAEELISRPGELVDPVLIGAAMMRAARRAYRSVREPAEGTILTVMFEMATRVASDVAHGGGAALPEDAPPDLQNAVIAQVLEGALQSGEESVLTGPALLPVLRQAGVVDAGGHALTVLFAGVIAALRGTEPPEVKRHGPARVSHPEHESSTFRYCTNFAVIGHDLDATPWIPRLERLGDSVLVVGDTSTLKVHLHTDEPESATALFAEIAEVSHLDVADMRAQVADRDARLATGPAVQPDARCAVLAVVAGDGLRDLYAAIGGVVCLDGGPTMNPSTYELLAGIHEVPAEEVVVLPNSPNVLMAAERAADLSEKVVHVVASRSPQAGLNAVYAHDPARSAAENADALRAALAHVRTGGVAPAARDDGQGRFLAGQAVGYVDEELVAWGEVDATLRDVLARLGVEAELVTCLIGEGAPLAETDVQALAPPDVDLEVEPGGQPAWWWLLAAE